MRRPRRTEVALGVLIAAAVAANVYGTGPRSHGDAGVRAENTRLESTVNVGDWTPVAARDDVPRHTATPVAATRSRSIAKPPTTVAKPTHTARVAPKAKATTPSRHA